MKTLLFAMTLALAACSSVTAPAITVSSPANNTQVTSPFTITASTATCGGVPAVSMGYSLDHSSAIIVPTAFTASVTAAQGTHVLHIKCWGKQTNDETLLNITVVPAPKTDTTVTAPVNGATVSSPFTVAASTQYCGGVPALSMGYSLDSGSAVVEPTSFNASVTASAGTHVLHVKCWGKGTSDQKLLNITVAAPTSDITIGAPLNGTKINSPFTLTASTRTCLGTPATSMAYAIDGHPAVSEPASFSTSVTANNGTHILHVLCQGKNVTDQAQLTIDVVPPTPASTPLFSLPSGTYASKQVVAMSDATVGATIYYTTDGSGPSTSSLRYSGPIAVNSSMVIEALAAAPGYANSGLARASYTIKTPSGAQIPSNAISVNGIQAMPNWRIKHDPATGSTSSGSKVMVSDPSLSGQTAKFDTTFTNNGGELYSVTYDKDPNAHNFVYDAQVWIASGSSIGNLEMDNNQVMANGDTVIYAFQCAGFSNTWDYSENAGTPDNPVVHWVHSSAPCNPKNWTPDTWHHVQISYSRDDNGNVTYHSVWLDGVETPINETVNSDFRLRWASGILVANFQVDGMGTSGDATLYLDNLTVYRW